MGCDIVIYEGKEYSKSEFLNGVRSGEVHLPQNARNSVNRIMAQQKTEHYDLEDNNSLDVPLNAFMGTLGFSVKEFDELKSITGYDALAAVDLVNKVVLNSKNTTLNDVAKQAAYVAYVMLGKKNKIRTDLIHSISTIPNYDSIFNDYKDRNNNLSKYKINELITIDFLADAIQSNFEVPKTSYINRKSDYWTIQGGSAFEKKLKYLLNVLKRYFQSLYKGSVLSYNELQDLADDIANDVLKKNMYKFNYQLKPDQQLVNYEDTISKDSVAKNIIETAQTLGLLLTGSLTLRKQGTLYRSSEETLHDLDFTVPYPLIKQDIDDLLNNHLIKNGIDSSVENFPSLREKFLENNYMNLSFYKSFLLSYPDFKVTSIFRSSVNCLVVSGKTGKHVIDFFLYETHESFDNDKDFLSWKDTFIAKLKMGRAKDMLDHVHYHPYIMESGMLAQEPGLRYFSFKDNFTVDKEFYEDIIPDEIEGPGFKTMPFKFSGHKIISGEKTITVRPGVYNAATYRDTTTNKLFNVLPQGNFYLQEYLALTNISKDDFVKQFIGHEEIKFKHIKDFLNNELPLNVYSVKEVVDFEDVIPEFEDSRYAQFYDNRKSIIKNLRIELKKAKGEYKEVIRSRIERIEKQVELLSDENNLNINTLIDIMEGDMEAVESILNANVDRQGLEYASTILYNYSTMLDSQFRDTIELLDDQTKLRIMAFQTRNLRLSERIKQKLLEIPINLVREMTGKTIPIINGLPVTDKDINWITRKTLDTSLTNNPVVQTLTRIINDALAQLGRRYESFKTTHAKIVKDLIDFQKSKGLSKDQFYDFMIQTDEEGKRTGLYVDRYSAEYNKLVNSSTGNARLVFYANNHTFTINKKAWDERQERLRLWFMTHVGPKITLTDWEMDNNVNIDDKIEKACNSYIGRFDPYTMNKIFEKVKKSPEFLSEEDLEFFKYYEKNARSSEKGEKVLNFIPDKKWHDARYDEIVNMADNDPRKVFYNHFNKTYKEGRQILSDEEGFLPWNYIPEKIKDLGVGGNLRQWAVNNISQVISENIHGRHPITNEIIKRIPVFSVSGKLSAEDKSYDLGDVLENFNKEVLNYDEKYQIEDHANLLLSLIKSMRIPKKNADGTDMIVNGQKQYQEGLSNMYYQAAYKLGASLYDERQEKEGVSGIKVKGTLLKRKLEDLRKKMDDLHLSEEEKLEAWDHVRNNTAYEGHNENITKFISYAYEAWKLKQGGSNITSSKIVNSLIHFTSVKLLGLNVFGGFAELLQGWTSFFTESGSGRYFNDKEAIKAFGDMIKLGGPESETRRKIMNLGKYLGMHVDRASQENMITTKIGKAAFWQWEFANKTTNMMFMTAFLRNKKVTDKQGVEHSLFDVIECDEYGNFSLKGDFDLELMENGRMSKYVLDLRHQLKQVLKDDRERQTFEFPAELEQHMLGRILGQFKASWLFNALYSRFGEHMETDLMRGVETKGFYRSFLEQFKLRKVKDEFGDLVYDFSTAGISDMIGRVLMSFVRYSKIGRMMGVQADPRDTDLDVANLQKFMRELSWVITVSITITVLSSMGGGGDDKDRFRRFTINQLIRLQRDLSGYMNPSALASHLKNPAPIVGTISDLTGIFNAAIQTGIYMDPYTHKGDLRIWKATERNIPYLNQYDKILNKLEKTLSYQGY